MPSVTTRELNFNLVTRIPLIKPMKRPVITAKKRPNPGYPVLIQVKEKTQSVSPMVDGKDKSLSPLTTTKIREQASISGIGYTVKSELYIRKSKNTLGFIIANKDRRIIITAKTAICVLNEGMNCLTFIITSLLKDSKLSRTSNFPDSDKPWLTNQRYPLLTRASTAR